MKSLEVITKLAAKFEQKLSLAQSFPGEIDKVLTDAGVRPTANDIGPLLDNAKIPNNISLNIGITVDPSLAVKFNVVGNPAHNSTQVLAGLLDRTYSAKMSTALKSGKTPEGKKIELTHPVAVPMATF